MTIDISSAMNDILKGTVEEQSAFRQRFPSMIEFKPVTEKVARKILEVQGLPSDDAVLAGTKGGVRELIKRGKALQHKRAVDAIVTVQEDTPVSRPRIQGKIF